MQLLQFGLLLTTAALVPFGQAAVLHQRGDQVMVPEAPASGNATAPAAHKKRIDLLAGTCRKHKGYPSGECVHYEPVDGKFRPKKTMRCGEGKYMQCNNVGDTCWWDSDDDDTPALAKDKEGLALFRQFPIFDESLGQAGNVL
ncbi:uncharacterized protein PG986_011291 [Apiospora aurea]|uniref:Uncharacterized protein n=1 Tax=Apiospora aurea TaxID=335848 RepID=A0ABR1Q4Q9_9PEZI